MLSPTLKIGIGIFAGILGLILMPMNSITVLAILILLNLIHVIYGFWIWVNRE
jgi:hypothetical protein